MLKNTFVWFSLIALSLFSSCETEFSVNGEYTEKPIVHFLLDPNDTLHYLKLNKTFLGDGSALDFAQVPDSSYFENVVAIVEEVMGTPSNESVTRSWTLKDTITENKKEGIFYYPEQKLYYFKAEDLNVNAKYRLRIDIENGTHSVYGETNLVSGVSINGPLPTTAFNLANNDVPANGYRNQRIDFSKGDGAIFNCNVIFSYKETTTSGTEIKEVDWNLGEIKGDEISSQTGAYIARGEQFYELLASRIPLDDNVIRRTTESIEIILTAGSHDLLTYMLVNQPTSSLAQNKQEFSNVDGALGIFSSRTTVTQFKPAINNLPPQIRALNTNSTKELCEGQYTVNLGFCSNISVHEDATYYCN